MYNNLKKIAVVTATRAEYGALAPLINKINLDEYFELDLIVTGMHLSEKYGMTINEIEKDGNPISHKINILEGGSSSVDVSYTVANAIKSFSDCFHSDKPDIVIISGDRTEMLGIAIAAMNEQIPIAHIHGGEVTQGAVDDCVRHSLTKMSYLHFATTEVYRSRIIQLGEDPQRVFNVGALSTEIILKYPLIDEQTIREELLVNKDKYVLVTFHPETLSKTSPRDQIAPLIDAIKNNLDLFYIITASNSDAGGDIINSELHKLAALDNVVCYESLGMKKYISAIKYAHFIIGNSSSGIMEAPSLGTPSVNIGDRQQGRIMAETVIHCTNNIGSITEAINKARVMTHRATSIFGNGDTSDKIIKAIKDFIKNNRINLRKSFVDISF